MISLGISHTPWVPERVESMRRLRSDLGLTMSRQRPDGTPIDIGALCDYRVLDDRAPNWVWSSDMWRWAAETDAGSHLFLQDDALVATNFWPALRAMLEAVPDQIIGLESVHPATMTLARAGHRWATTADGLIGVGYVFPHKLLVDFLDWRAHDLVKGAVEAITEDTLVGLYAMSKGLRIWHPIPTLIDHDVALDSTYGNDAHQFRRPLVKWSDGDVCGWTSGDLERPAFWDPERVTHLGRFYAGTHWLAKQWVKDWTLEMHAAAEADATPERFAQWV